MQGSVAISTGADCKTAATFPVLACAANKVVPSSTCYCGKEIASAGDKCTTADIDGVKTPACKRENAVCDMDRNNCVVVKACMCGEIEAGFGHICTPDNTLAYGSKCLSSNAACAENLSCDGKDGSNTCVVAENQSCTDDRKCMTGSKCV